jgi:HEAT repeat protein
MERKSRSKREMPESKSTAQLLQLSDSNTWRILKERTSQEDVRMLIAAARNADDGAKSAALISLGHQNNDTVLDLAELAVRNGSEQVARAGRMALFRLSSDLAVTKARAWIREPGHLGDAAAHILSAHGTAADVPVLREALKHARAEEDVYAQSSIVDGLGRLGDERVATAIEAIFVETTYSYLRRRAAHALAQVSPTFSRTLAIECLWDCEADTRLLACSVAPLEIATVRERITELAADVVEEEDVRHEADARLTSAS